MSAITNKAEEVYGPGNPPKSGIIELFAMVDDATEGAAAGVAAAIAAAQAADGEAAVAGALAGQAVLDEALPGLVTPDLSQVSAATMKRRSNKAAPINNRVALLGDSITQSGIANGVIDGVSTDANALRNSTRGMTFWVPFLTRQRFVSPQSLNFGVSGQTSAQILARVGDVIASGAGVCVVLAGTNDIGGSASTTKANLAAIYQALADANVLIIAVSILPRRVSTGAQYGFINEVNAWIENQQSVYPNFKYIDAMYAYGLETATDMSPRDGYAYDFLHPMGIGMRNVSRPVADYLNTLLPEPAYPVRVTDHFSIDHLTEGYINPNPFVRGTGGTVGSGVTGTVADNWQIATAAGGGSIGSLVVNSGRANDSRGIDSQRIEVSGTATGGYQTVVALTQYGYTPISPLQSGDQIFNEVEIELEGGAIGIAGVACFVAATVGGVDYFAWDGYPIVSDGFTQDALSGKMRTPSITLSGVPTLVQSGIYIYLMNTGSTRACAVKIPSAAVRATR